MSVPPAGLGAPSAPAWPLPADEWSRLTTTFSRLDNAQLHWISGFAAGLAAARSPVAEAIHLASPSPISAASAATAASVLTPVTVLFASHTGNGKGIANKLAQELGGADANVRVQNVRDYITRELKDERLLIAVVSTHGDGEPPDDAKAFFEFLLSAKAPKLTQLQFAVLALGDSSYPQFCAAGKILDERLLALGGKRLFARIEADVDFAKAADAFRQQANDQINALRQTHNAVVVGQVAAPVSAVSVWTRDNPFNATLVTNQRITSNDAEKDVRHLEFAISDAGLRYQPGDAVGVWAKNDPVLVERLLTLLKRSDSDVLNREGKQQALGKWLRDDLEITQLSLPVLKKLAELNHNSALVEQLQSDKLAAFLAQHQLVDVLAQYGVPSDSDALLQSLRALTPRLYSIASSQLETPDELHTTLGVRQYEAFGFTHRGAASGYLAQLAAGSEVAIYIHENDNFRLPSDHSKPILMIGPGTGVAPFRAFVQQRVVTGASGKNWLLFGEQRRRQTFLYQREWLDYLKRGQLHRLDVAFSRDLAHKVYVQDRLREHGRDVYAHVEEGGFIYVCGDAKGMAPAVNQALREVIMLQGGRSQERADEYLQQLVREQRYQRDVY